MTIRESLIQAAKKLKKSKSASPELDAEVLLSYVLNKSKADIFGLMAKRVEKGREKKFFNLINKRALGWPVAYLTKEKEFYGLKFYVDKNVLIPRPETEGLVELILEKLKSPAFAKASTDRQKNLKILDIGTGSGCIAVSLAKNLPGKFFASDVSSVAIKIAKKNAKLHKVAIIFKQGSLLEPWKNQNFDIIIANLPYLTKRTDPSTKFEPTKALIGAKKGLALFEELFKQVYHLSPITYNLFLEIGHDQSKQIKKLAKIYLPEFETKISKDLSGRARFAVLEPGKKSV